MFPCLESGWRYDCFNQKSMVEVTLYNFWGWVIKNHPTSAIFTRSVCSKRSQTHVKSLIILRPPCLNSHIYCTYSANSHGWAPATSQHQLQLSESATLDVLLAKYSDLGQHHGHLALAGILKFNGFIFELVFYEWIPLGPWSIERT